MPRPRKLWTASQTAEYLHSRRKPADMEKLLAEHSSSLGGRTEAATLGTFGVAVPPPAYVEFSPVDVWAVEAVGAERQMAKWGVKRHPGGRYDPQDVKAACYRHWRLDHAASCCSAAGAGKRYLGRISRAGPRWPPLERPDLLQLGGAKNRRPLFAWVFALAKYILTNEPVSLRELAFFYATTIRRRPKPDQPEKSNGFRYAARLAIALAEEEPIVPFLTDAERHQQVEKWKLAHPGLASTKNDS